MIKTAVVGATGYAGAELVKIIAGHPKVELSILTSKQFAGKPFDQIYPAMAGIVDKVCQAYSADEICDNADIVFMALPHKLPMKLVPELIKKGKKVIDLSADFRFKSSHTYELFYQPHSAKDLIPKAVYGLSEIYADIIRTTDLVGNPGCYPTSTLLPLIPLVRKTNIIGNTVIVDSKSGVSGAGRSLSLTTHFCEVNESFKAYKVAEHRHNPEIEEILKLEAKRDISLTFVPHLVPMTRGMLTTMYVPLKEKISWDEIFDCFSFYYQDRPFIRICPKGKYPDTLNVRGTNYCDIGFKLDDKRQVLILISAIDNLVKGAAGQAVQNMNIMLGLDEMTGL